MQTSDIMEIDNHRLKFRSVSTFRVVGFAILLSLKMLVICLYPILSIIETGNRLFISTSGDERISVPALTDIRDKIIEKLISNYM